MGDERYSVRSRGKKSREHSKLACLVKTALRAKEERLIKLLRGERRFGRSSEGFCRALCSLHAPSGFMLGKNEWQIGGRQRKIGRTRTFPKSPVGHWVLAPLWLHHLQSWLTAGRSWLIVTKSQDPFRKPQW